jgi:hypothetical protein
MISCTKCVRGVLVVGNIEFQPQQPQRERTCTASRNILVMSRRAPRPCFSPRCTFHNATYTHINDNEAGPLSCLNFIISHQQWTSRLIETRHVQTVNSKLEILYMNGQPEMEKQAHLLRSLKLDLEAISKITNPTGVSVAIVREAVDAGEKGR